MTIRILQTTASPRPDVPFQAGQIITLDPPPIWMLDLCDGVRAEAVKDDRTEFAVVRSARKKGPRS